MKTYNGSCSCSKVTFEVRTELTRISKCNCSICNKKGIIHHVVDQNQFNLISGKDNLSLYQFGTMRAKHYFCKHCGIHLFNNPRTYPEKVSVNVNCLDDFDLEKEMPKVVKFDGRNWEEAFKSLEN
jgi:hypothetical protein|tara:strand:- start:43 stop:420 length:378 start_codon:yes stop_codon:yes gene_type:complete